MKELRNLKDLMMHDVQPVRDEETTAHTAPIAIRGGLVLEARTLPPSRPPLAPGDQIAWRGEEERLVGIVSQADVLVVCHERNMRSKLHHSTEDSTTFLEPVSRVIQHKRPV